MFSNSSYKIRIFALIWFILLAILLVVGSIGMMSTNLLFGIIMLVAGGLSAWMIALLVFSIGETWENTEEITVKVERMEEVLHKLEKTLINE